MSKAKVHLLKTLTAMRWIAMMNGNKDLVKAVEQDLKHVGGK